MATMLQHLHQQRRTSAPSAVRGTLTLLAICLLGTNSSICFAGSTSGGQLSERFKQQIEFVQKASTSSDKALYSDALYDLAVRYNNINDLENAKKFFAQSLQVEQGLKRPNQQIDVRMQLARIALVEGKLNDALKQFDDTMAFAQQNNIGIASVEVSLATALMQLGKIAEAEQHYKAALADQTPNQQLVQAKAMQMLATICQRTARYTEGLNYLKQAADLLERFGDQGHYGLALAQLAYYQDKSGDPKTSMQSYQQIEEKFDARIFPDVQAMAEFGRADNLYDRQRVKEARDHFAKAVQNARENRDEQAKDSLDLLAQCLIGLGTAEADLEHFSDAEKAHTEALELAKKSRNQQLVVEAGIQLAQDYLIEGRPERALHHLMNTLKETQDADLKPRANTLAAIGRCYRGLGQMSSATRCYREALNLYDQLHDPQSKAVTLNSLAVLYLDSGDFKNFDATYAQAKEVSASLPVRDQCRSDYTYAQSKVMRGDYPTAEQIYKSALAKLQETGDEGLQSAILRGLGTCTYLSGRYAESLNYFREAWAMSADAGSIETQWDCNLGVGKAYKALKQYKEAEPFLRQAVELVERERSDLTRDSFKTFNLGLRKECFQELVDLLVQTDRAYESLEIAERGKARAFLDMLANRKDRRIAGVVDGGAGANGGKAASPVLVASADTGSGSRSITIAAKPEDDNRSVSLTSKDDDSRMINVNEKFDESNTYEETAISPVNADAPAADEIKSLVAKRRSTCVEFLVASKSIYTWVVHPDGSINTSPPVPVPADFRDRVHKLLVNMTKSVKTPGEMQALAVQRQAELSSLYRLLIKPIESYLPKDKGEVVTIVPHDVLFKVPFAALMAENGDFLIERHTLSYAPAIGVLRATQKLQEQVAQVPHRLVAFGNPITERIAFLGALPYAEKEVRHIAKIFGEPNATVVVGGEATKQKFEELMPHAAEIHIATHGLVDEGHPMKSALVLAPTDKDDGLLSVRDILTLKNMKARLVVLSACQTARGQLTGEGVVDGLCRAFIIAGAPSILVSQWNVDDIMTEFQMEKFYKFYLNGSDRARALRDAQLATIRYMENSDGTAVAHDLTKARANPRYWAAFQLIGEI